MDASVSNAPNNMYFTELSHWITDTRGEKPHAMITLALPSHLQHTASPICWEMMNIEESLTTLAYTTELPTIENFFGIVHKCRKQRNLEYACRMLVHIHDKGLDAHKALGNHLVPLFVECGSLFQADQIFHRLTYRNEFSWTSLIHGYVECGKYQHALDLFEMMQDACIQPSTCTFLALLKACAKMKWVERGRKMHANIDDMGYQCDPCIGNSLVGMYAKCGSLVEARETFDKLLVQDVVSWNSLITGYVEHGLDKEALVCVKQLHSEGISPDAITFICSLKACGNIGAFETSCILHTEIVERAMDIDPVIGNALVDMYARTGKFAEARRVLDKLPSRDVISWCSLLTGYIEHGLGEEALNCLEQMQQDGVCPDVLTYVCSLKACAIMGSISVGETLHTELIIEGFEGDLYVGNILVDMYAKCGCLLEAEDVFDELVPVRDIISWNTLIAAYVEHGRGEEALDCLEQMQSEGVLRNAATYVSSLKACSSKRDLAKGQELLVEIAVEGFNEDLLLINCLVDLFAKCGSFVEARDLFEEQQPVKDVATWNALISGYVENDFVDEVLNCMEQMQKEGVTQDAITFVCGLKACGSIRATNRVLQMHADMMSYGLDQNAFVENTLVDVYARCGLLMEARQVLECLSLRETLTWCALMAGFLEHGLAEEALECLEQMETEGLSPSAITYLCSLKACASMEATDKGREIHSNIVKHGYSRDPFVGSSLVGMYSKCGLLHEAQMLLADLTNRDVVSWTTLILGFAENGFGDKALEFFIEMESEGIFPNATTYICCLKVCSNTRTIDRGQEFHMEAVKAGFDGDHMLTNTLVDMYSKCGSLEEAHKVFKHLLNPDAISWTALISGYAEHGLAQEAIIFLEQMQQDGISPTSDTFLCSIKGCAAIRAIQRGHILHAQLVRLGLEDDAFIGTALVDMYSKCGLFGDAYEMLNQLRVLDAISWTALLSGYAEYGHVMEALECLKEMQAMGVFPDEVSWNAVISGFSQQGESSKASMLYARMQEQGIMPDCSTLVSILEAYGEMASYENGRRVHAQSQGLGEKKSPDMVMSTALIDMYSKCGSMKDAQHMFDAVVKRDCFSWTAIITAYARQGSTELVLSMFEKMREEAIKPDDVTFLSIFSACRHSGLVGKGQMLFQAMVSKYGIFPTTKHQNCMVDLFCRAGQLSEAALLLQTMPGQPDVVTWSSILSACQSWGEVDLGRQAFQCMGSFDNESNASAFILMSNMVASADETEVKESIFMG